MLIVASEIIKISTKPILGTMRLDLPDEGAGGGRIFDKSFIKSKPELLMKTEV